MGRKPLGKKAMTDAERQRRRRQKLCAAKPNFVTYSLSRNGQSADTHLQEVLQKKIDRLEKENKRCREDAKGWKRLREEAASMVDRLLKEMDGLQAERSKQQLKLERLREELHNLQMERLFKPPIVSTWFRTLSMRFHPDRGGSDVEMKVVNEAHDALRALLKPS